MGFLKILAEECCNLATLFNAVFAINFRMFGAFFLLKNRCDLKFTKCNFLVIKNYSYYFKLYLITVSKCSLLTVCKCVSNELFSTFVKKKKKPKIAKRSCNQNWELSGLTGRSAISSHHEHTKYSSKVLGSISRRKCSVLVSVGFLS